MFAKADAVQICGNNRVRFIFSANFSISNVGKYTRVVDSDPVVLIDSEFVFKESPNLGLSLKKDWIRIQSEHSDSKYLLSRAFFQYIV